MDPAGPWSAYASYNRLTGVQSSTGGDIHPQLTQSATPSTTSTQIVAGGFLPTAPVGYETVFNPVFPHSGSKPPVQYITQVSQHPQPPTQPQAGTVSTKPGTEGEYQGQAYFEQTGAAWQQNSPFGVLPHESISPTTTTSKTVYENFNAHFVAAQNLNQLNTQLVSSNSKNAITRVQTTPIAKSSQPNTVAFFQVAAANTKSFGSTDASNLQQTCIVTSPNNVSSKDYRVIPSNPNFLNSSARPTEKPFTALPDKQTLPQIQTKAQTKIYPELNSQGERLRTENQTQSSPISFSVDVPGCLNYTNNNSAKRTQFQSSTYRHYQPGNNTENEFQHTKGNMEYNNSNGSDCSGIGSRRASPQTHSQASPLGHAQSPAYPMYNSPLNSVPSPQHNSKNQVTSSSPLDATITRANAQSIAYPSVITRTLNSDKKFPEHYERSVQQQQDCWDDQQAQQQRKFQNHPSVPTNYINNLNVPPRISEHCQSRNIPPQDRQVYYNTTSSHQVPLQDIATSRGDPISLVKNIQQIPQLDIKQDTKISNRRRKSNEKLPNELQQGAALSEYFASRIPPPAHSTAANQQQNGAYYDYDRWNLPPPSKIFGSQTVHQQHQAVMVSHPHSHHPPPPLPYFPPFHLGTHPEYTPSVEYPPAAYNQQPSQQNSSTPLTEESDSVKVVVPNIEEELEFLSGEGVKPTISHAAGSVVRPSTIVNQASSNDKTSGTAGFMNSYLKFLQGERTSPPPAARANRKQSWSRTKPIQQTIAQTNGVVTTPTQPPLPTIPATRLSQGDPQDDPRYFPLPKERKKNRFDSSDDGFSSDDDLFKRNVMLLKDNFSKERNFKRSAARPVGTGVNRKPMKKPVRPKNRGFESDKGFNTPIVPSNLPRRESSRRAAKEKTNLRQMIGEDEIDNIDYMDSDSDPAWSPKRNEDNEVVAVMSKGRKIKNGKKRPSRNLITAAAECAGINDLDGYTSDGTGNSKRPNVLGNIPVQKPVPVPTLEDNASSPVVPAPVPPSIDNPFKPGEFLAVKTDLASEWPPIWRVDGKALLQRYEPFDQNGQMLYKNVQTYTAWTTESLKQYTPVPVSYKVQTQSEIIVEFLRNDVLGDVDFTVIEKSMEGSKVYQDNFEVYIQTLISQALDSNFLTEIFQEQDDYFLSNVKTIDDITDKQKNKMTYVLQWPKEVLLSINTWPCFNIINEFNGAINTIRSCATCLKPGISVRVLMYGQPYNITTLEGCQADPYSVEKDFLMCRLCANRVELFNKITHQKYLMYVQCSKKVTEKRTSNPNKDTTCILNELLADETWLNKLFNEVRYSWAEVDSLEYRYKLNNQCSDSTNDKTVL